MKLNYSSLFLTDYEQKIAQALINTKTNELRVSKPALPKKIQIDCVESFTGHTYVYKDEADKLKGETAYVWRMLAFYVGIDPHMPCTVYFYLEGTSKQADTRAKELDILVDKLMSVIPKSEWKGIKTWGSAFGFVLSED